jgi:hypothetical protein
MNFPKPADLHPVIIEKEFRRNKLHTTQIAMKADCAMLRARLQTAPSTGNANDNRVRQILGEAPLAETAPDKERLDQLLQDLQAINSAIGVLDHELYTQRNIGSRLVCDSVPVKTEVDKRAKVYAQALIAFQAASFEYNRFIDELENTGVNVASLNRIHLSHIGSPRDPSGTFHYSLMEFVYSKIISRSDLPKEIR